MFAGKLVILAKVNIPFKFIIFAEFGRRYVPKKVQLQPFFFYLIIVSFLFT